MRCNEDAVGVPLVRGLNEHLLGIAAADLELGAHSCQIEFMHSMFCQSPRPLRLKSSSDGGGSPLSRQLADRPDNTRAVDRDHAYQGSFRPAAISDACD